MDYEERRRHKHKRKSRSVSRERYSRNKDRDHHKKHKKRYSSSDDSSESRSRSSSSHSSPERRHKHKKKSKSKKKKSRERSRERPPPRAINLTEDDIELLKAKRKKEKELIKALETPEEKRARRLAKKEAKERKRKTHMGWDDEYLGYSNADNPFGDEHLHETFIWNKKLDKEGKSSLERDEIQKIQKRKMIETKIELEKVKKRRLEREKEREEREREREQEQREKESEYYRAWETQEDQFHLEQAKLRSKIRIEDGRAKPIDLLAKYIDTEEVDFSVEMHEPYTYLNGLTITDLEDLLEDIKVYVELENGKNVEYWKDITIITEEELSKLRKLDPTARDQIGERRRGMNHSVQEDVVGVFKGKTLKQLTLLETQIKTKLQGGEGVDVGYWESLLQQLKAHMAKSRLREKHQEQLRRKLFKLKQEQGIESTPLFPIVKEEGRGSNASSAKNSPAPHRQEAQKSVPSPKPSSSSSTEVQPGTSKEGEEEKSEEKEESGEEEEAIITEEDVEDQCCIDYDAGKYSPQLLQVADLEVDALVYDPEEDMKRLELARNQVLLIGRAKIDVETEFEKKAREGMNDDEAQFSVEVPLEKQTLLWSDKYRPRKPRFFNRVHTGFEWNKYNQTHYDIDNPPPKIVQGYKFNIFYPDLIDKTKTPEYTLTPCEGDPDFSTLRFRAGPPYEDIAFKIVNREWEYSYKRGFRCQYHNNIFQLWFHFKRYRYRR